MQPSQVAPLTARSATAGLFVRRNGTLALRLPLADRFLDALPMPQRPIDVENADAVVFPKPGLKMGVIAKAFDQSAHVTFCRPN